ncbi:MAG: MoxR family ATPase [Chloroflexota bacterium]|nr:MoxR family ATPase [Chloroflexota bacterium]MDE2959044.1 MoxR family ATPase [Chloroflexota bacterium]
MITAAQAQQIADTAARIRDNIQLAIVGKDEVIEYTLAALFSAGHILVEDVPGIGKTTLARSLAYSLDCEFRRIQFTPDLMPSDITGIHYYNQHNGEFEFRPGPVISQVVLADEINRATPRTQSALLEAMAERQVTVDQDTVPLPAPFLVLATQNPIELEGTFPLPEAQIDRFMLRLRLGYPSEDDETAMLERFEDADPLSSLGPVASADDVLRIQALVRQVYIDPVLRAYLVQVIRATREHPDVELGASPRATLGLYRCAQALAGIRGQEYVTPDDIKTLATPALAHRIILKSMARLRERSQESVVNEVLEAQTVPV